MAGLRFQAPNFDRCLYFAFRELGDAAGVMTTDTDDILACESEMYPTWPDADRGVALGL